MQKKIIYVDIDETICETPYIGGKRYYYGATPIPSNIEKINKLYDDGHQIVYWTARGSRSGINWYDLTLSQISSWGCKFHSLRLDKPYYDLFIDDKNMRIEELNDV